MLDAPETFRIYHSRLIPNFTEYNQETLRGLCVLIQIFRSREFADSRDVTIRFSVICGVRSSSNILKHIGLLLIRPLFSQVVVSFLMD